MDLVVLKTITAEDTYTDAVKVACKQFEKTDPRNGYLNISVSGTFVASVILQRSFDNGTTWKTVETFTGEKESAITDYENDVLYRLGVATGGFTSGTIAVRLSH